MRLSTERREFLVPSRLHVQMLRCHLFSVAKSCGTTDTLAITIASLRIGWLDFERSFYATSLIPPGFITNGACALKLLLSTHEGFVMKGFELPLISTSEGLTPRFVLLYLPLLPSKFHHNSPCLCLWWTSQFPGRRQMGCLDKHYAIHIPDFPSGRCGFVLAVDAMMRGLLDIFFRQSKLLDAHPKSTVVVDHPTTQCWQKTDVVMLGPGEDDDGWHKCSFDPSALKCGTPHCNGCPSWPSKLFGNWCTAMNVVDRLADYVDLICILSIRQQTGSAAALGLSQFIRALETHGRDLEIRSLDFDITRMVGCANFVKEHGIDYSIVVV
ncbi:hypothetical protein BKA70DRAFT_1215908 [Coprinopsis sp. MPI-PUGE-AT-0042]|nr:hypothetical protein BKA70DRAFT_1215908 [Coprinopsis sp. MPI-PUGE-AT-0042]